jgi:hypothetical protein
MRNGQDRRSENPLLGHAKKERAKVFGTDQRITSVPAAKTAAFTGRNMAAPERFAQSRIPLAPRAPSARPVGDMRKLDLVTGDGRIYDFFVGLRAV